MTHSSIRHCFPKTARLRKARQFRTVSKYGRSVAGSFILLQIRDNKRSSGAKLGLTVSRKFGNAVERNRFKRLIREAFRQNQHQLPPSLELNVRPAIKATKNLCLSTLTKELLRLAQSGS